MRQSLGGLVPELADALRAAAQQHMQQQKPIQHLGGRSKYLRYKDDPTRDIDPVALERHRRTKLGFLP